MGVEELHQAIGADRGQQRTVGAVGNHRRRTAEPDPQLLHGMAIAGVEDHYAARSGRPSRARRPPAHALGEPPEGRVVGEAEAGSELAAHARGAQEGHAQRRAIDRCAQREQRVGDR